MQPRRHETTKKMISFSSCLRAFVTSWLYSCSACLPQNPPRRVPTRRAHDAAPGMRGRPTHPQTPNRRRVLRPARRRPQEEQLLERKLSLENVAFGEPEFAFKVERREHLLVQDDVADVRRIIGN